MTAPVKMLEGMSCRFGRRWKNSILCVIVVNKPSIGFTSANASQSPSNLVTLFRMGRKLARVWM